MSPNTCRRPPARRKTRLRRFTRNGASIPGIVRPAVWPLQAQPPRGSGREIWMLQRRPGRMGAGLGLTTGWVVRAALAARGVQDDLPASPIERSTTRGSTSRWTATDRVLEVDTIVVCAGQEPERGLAEAVASSGMPVRVVGGARDAEGLDAFRAIEEGPRGRPRPLGRRPPQQRDIDQRGREHDQAVGRRGDDREPASEQTARRPRWRASRSAGRIRSRWLIRWVGPVANIRASNQAIAIISRLSTSVTSPACAK